eukprot:GHRR01001143.1.p1 GENE.GHRR01001143.1~~GHRR01001143.1.p1  ORF type:complete len:683 (+),score=290.06 GHRR01001143.1:1311-3359(+)
MEEEALVRQAIQESLQTHTQQQRRQQDTSTVDQPLVQPTAPPLTIDGPYQTSSGSNSGLSYQQQMQEAVHRRARHWQEMHGQPGSVTQQQQQQGAAVQQPTYPSIPGFQTWEPLPNYPAVPSPLQPEQQRPAAQQSVTAQLDSAPSWQVQADEEQKRLQQEEEDYQLALQLAESFEQEAAAAAEGTARSEAPYSDHNSESSSSSGGGSQHSDRMSDDSEWQRVNRTPSMQQHVQVGGSSGDRADGSTHDRASLGTAAAAADSITGGLVGAGVSALLAIAAQAASRAARQQHTSEASATAAASSRGGTASHSSIRHDAAASAAAGGTDWTITTAANRDASIAGTAAAPSGPEGASGISSSQQQQPAQGLLGTVANTLWNFVLNRMRQSSTTNTSSSASASASAGAHSGSSSDGQQQAGSSRRGRRQADEHPSEHDLAMLQQVLQQLFMGSAVPPSARSGGGGSSSGQPVSGFRVTRLPGGGFAATYSSGTGGSSGQHHCLHEPGRHPGHDDNYPFGPFGDDAVRGDFLTQLLLAGARSARQNSRGQQQQGLGGFAHFDPISGSTRYEQGGPPSLEALIGAMMGHGMFAGMGEAGGGFRYEDLQNLENVQVTAPADILEALPKSKYVEGRKPGDSDTCIICQSPYAAGEELMYLPCLHAFHTDCIKPWLEGHSKKCPVCKTDVC